MTWPPGLVVSVLVYGPRGPGSIPLWAPIFRVFFSLIFSVLLLNYFILVKWNYTNYKIATPEHFILNTAQNLCGQVKIWPS